MQHGGFPIWELPFVRAPCQLSYILESSSCATFALQCLYLEPFRSFNVDNTLKNPKVLHIWPTWQGLYIFKKLFTGDVRLANSMRYASIFNRKNSYKASRQYYPLSVIT